MKQKTAKELFDSFTIPEDCCEMVKDRYEELKRFIEINPFAYMSDKINEKGLIGAYEDYVHMRQVSSANDFDFQSLIEDVNDENRATAYKEMDLITLLLAIDTLRHQEIYEISGDMIPKLIIQDYLKSNGYSEEYSEALDRIIIKRL